MKITLEGDSVAEIMETCGELYKQYLANQVDEENEAWKLAVITAFIEAWDAGCSDDTIDFYRTWYREIAA
jgi:hypothetical protein